MWKPGFMGHLCSCLQPQHQSKKQRRLSDVSIGSDHEYDSSTNRTINGEDLSDDGSDDGIHILIEGDGERDALLLSSPAASSVGHHRGAAVITKRTSKSALLKMHMELLDENAPLSPPTSTAESMTNSKGNGVRLLGDQQAVEPLSAAEQTRNLEVLRSYQQATGIIVDKEQHDLECVMCLDTFASDNPKVRTLCSCGMNRTNFHLSCLLEWLNRDANCPVCREYLFYEEP